MNKSQETKIDENLDAILEDLNNVLKSHGLSKLKIKQVHLDDQDQCRNCKPDEECKCKRYGNVVRCKCFKIR